MLIDFTIENYRSIRTPQTLSLLATSTSELPDNYFALPNEKKIRLLKSAVIYGPNASGKSNIVKALQNFLQFVRFSTDLKLDQPIPYYDPFKLCPNLSNAPTKFSIEFIEKNIRYQYSVAFDNTKVLNEELFYYPKKARTKLFVRNHGKAIDYGSSLTGPKKNIEEQLLDNVLFLSKAANNNNTKLQEAYRALTGRILVEFNSCSTPSSILEKMTGMLMTGGGELASVIKNFVKKIDNSITDIQIEKSEIDKSKVSFPDGLPEEAQKTLLDALCCEVTTTHALSTEPNNLIKFSLREESSGTIKSFNLAGHIAISLLSGSALVIDELNNSFHPVITRFIIELFNTPKSNPNNAQLIFTTHDTNFLDSSLFRRDQIWFIEKSKLMESEIYSLSEFDYKEVRNNTPFEKWYLSGKFGAIPIVNDFDMSFDGDLNAKIEN